MHSAWIARMLLSTVSDPERITHTHTALDAHAIRALFMKGKNHGTIIGNYHHCPTYHR